MEMSQVFDKNGKSLPVTLVKAMPNVVVQVKTVEKDGYVATQIGAGEKKAKNIKKPQRGHFKDLGNFRFLRESRLPLDLKAGDKIEVSVFEEGDIISVRGISKGKGFQGVVKRHGFHGGSRTHGQKHSEREPGSIGQTNMQRVMKGMRMAGRMGGEKVTVKNLKIAKIDKDQNIIAILGAVPGARGTLIEIKG